MENATIEVNDAEFEGDIEDMVVVCPWHEYDFSLSTGESSHGISACVYSCQVQNGTLHIQPPKPTNLAADQDADGATAKWELIELRPVSEAAPGVASRQDAANLCTRKRRKLSLSSSSAAPTEDADLDKAPPASKDDDALLPIALPSPTPKTLVEWAVLVLNTSDPVKKVTYTRLAAKRFDRANAS